MHCAEPWTALVLSPAEDRVTPCCDYSGHGAPLLEGGLAAIPDLWNSSFIRAAREAQAGRAPTPHGCTGCAMSFDAPGREDTDMFAAYGEDAVTPAQRANLEQARRDFERKVAEATAWPLKYVVFFGWGCNISCRICNQVPHRNQMKATLPPSAYQAWRPYFDKAVVLDCLGGEPFALPSGLDFLRQCAADHELDHVRLMITTNATLADRHLDWLAAKRRITFNVSIDSVGAGYESIRVGGKWEVVEANLRRIRRQIDAGNPDWRIKTNALMTRTGIAFLPDLAEFLTDADIRCSFHALRPTRGIEETLYQEDVLRYPHLLETVPDWQGKMSRAVDIFTRAGFSGEAGTIDSFRRQLAGEDRSAIEVKARRVLASVEGEALDRVVVGALGAGPSSREPGGFRAKGIGDGLVLGINFQGTLPQDGRVVLRLAWDKSPARGTAPCHAVLYDQPDFRLLRWEETRSPDNSLTKELIVQATRDPSGPARLLVALMTARPDALNLLPDRLELLET